MRMVGITEEKMMNDTRTDTLTYGDLVLVYLDYRRSFIVKLVRGGILGTDKGFIKHDEIIGRRYGDTIITSRGVKAYLIPPLLIDKLKYPRRTTQVIYPKDLSLMIYLSGINSGSKVVEAGVGTGFLTISIANFIGPEGKLYGFDLSEKRIALLNEVIRALGYTDRVHLRVGDIRGRIDLSDIDAAFLDIPDPWNAVESIYSVLKPGHPILIYIPTINQVEKTVVALKDHRGFIDIHSYELLLREYEVSLGSTRPQTLMIGHTGYIIFARKILREKHS